MQLNFLETESPSPATIQQKYRIHQATNQDGEILQMGEWKL